MLGYLMFILLVLWTIALLTGNYFEGFIHLLLLGILVIFGVRYFTAKELND